MSRVSAALKHEVIERAGQWCEYCRISQSRYFYSFHIEHIIAIKHAGATELFNLCLSCPDCNAHKGTDIASIDYVTGSLTPLFNPRIHQCEEHFQLNTALIEPLTPIGRVTEFLLQLNDFARLEYRTGLLMLGRYPCHAE